MPRRIAITGLDVLSCFGFGVDAFWQGCLAGPESVPAGRNQGWMRPLDMEAVQNALPDRRIHNRIDPAVSIALVSALAALKSAGDHNVPLDRCMVVLGSTITALDTAQHDYRLLERGEAKKVSAFNQPKLMANGSVANFSILTGFQGPSLYIGNACASGNSAMYIAVNLIRSGLADLAVAGGFEGTGHDMVTAGMMQVGVPSETFTSRPFDVNHDGVIGGEGAGVLVLEDWDHAVQRKATIWGEIVGVASTTDAHHLTSPAPDGVTQARCMSAAIADAGLKATDIRAVSAHGNATSYNDDAEAAAMVLAFQDEQPPVFSFKGTTGHTWGASGAMGTILLLKAMQEGVLPPTWGFTSPAPAARTLDVIHGEPRPWKPGPGMSNAFGFGGHNSCVVVVPPS